MSGLGVDLCSDSMHSALHGPIPDILRTAVHGQVLAEELKLAFVSTGYLGVRSP